MHRRFLFALCLFAIPSPLEAQELRLYPPSLTIAGPNAVQQFVLVEERDGKAIADHTASAAFTISKPAVAKIEGGLLTALGDGEAIVTAKVNGREATATVHVQRDSQSWSFRNHVEPVLTRAGCNSGACHGALAGKGGMKLSLRAYDPDTDHFILTRQAQARRIDGSKPEESLFLKKAIRAIPHGGGRKFVDDDDDYLLLLNWIRQGSPGPKAADAALDRIEIFPKAALLSPKSTLRVIVSAHYSDGHAEDVTRWTRFGSSEEQVAAVDEDGIVTAAGHGEAAITANFGTKVAIMPVASPFPNKVDPAIFAKAERHNFIDDHVLAKLKSLNIPPSAICTDSEFIRRVYLDTCGILPKPGEVKAFLADTSPEKRAKLVDSLLNRKEYVDYWSYRWSDLLLVSSRRLAQPAVWSFSRRVRQAVADNEPWDRFARDLLTASGNSLENGAANYFVIHKDTSELAESTSVTFLGISIACAKCHNHPLEKWTQDQYWAFTNLFSRVGLKAGERPGEVIVLERPDGDALHLRTGLPTPPAPLDGEVLPLDSDKHRREHLAKWLTAAENPFFAKALVNRVWRNYMGRGLVEAADDLRESNPSTNAELLDALAKDFQKNGHDVKWLMRTILLSAAYQRSSEPRPENKVDDRYYSRYLLRRLPAEVILDAYSDISGVPTPFEVVSKGPSGGTAKSTEYPAGTRAMELPDTLLVSRFLEAFGRPERVQTCSCERTEDSSVSQALHLNNGQTLNDKLRDPRSIVSRWMKANATNETVVDEIFLTGLARKPSEAEHVKFLAILDSVPEPGEQARREALEDLVWAILTGREFLFNH